MKEVTKNIEFKAENGQKFQSNLFIFSSGSDFDFSSLESILSKNELEKYQKFGAVRRKHSFLLGRFAAKKSLSQLVKIENLSEIDIKNGIFDFPLIYYKNINNIHISIAHSDHLGAAISSSDQHPITIDVEEISEKRSLVIAENLSENEVNMLKKLNLKQKISNFIIWTAKEALSKILRTGLTLSQEIMAVKEISQISKKEFKCIFKNFPQYQAIINIEENFIYSLVFAKNSRYLFLDSFVPFGTFE